MIDRRILVEILELIKLFPVVGLLGARQVGKTTFIKSIIPSIDPPCIYLDLEFPDDLAKLSDPSIFSPKTRIKRLL